MDWFYAVNGEQRGPVSEETLKSIYASGEIDRKSLVWRDGMADWATFGSVFPESASDAGEGLVSCPTCGASVSPDELIPAGNTQVCPNCKDTYAQGVKEGLSHPVVRPGARGTGGQTSNSELRAIARQALAGQWTNGVVITLLFFVMQIVMALIPFFGGLIQLVCQGPLNLGYHSFFLRLTREDNPEIGNLFHGFQNFVLGLGVYILMSLIVGLTSLLAALPGGILFFSIVIPNAQNSPETHPLFVVSLIAMILPAVVVSTWMYLRYSMAYFIAIDEPENGVMNALNKSPKLLYGFKGKLFLFGLSYIGWWILGMLAFFIGNLWTATYFFTGLAAFYNDLGETDQV